MTATASRWTAPATPMSRASTASDQATFPVTGGPDLTYNGSSDAFVAKVNGTGTALVYAGYIGGAGDD